MRKLIFLLIFMGGLLFSLQAQVTDPAYTQKINSLYRYTVPVIQSAELATGLSEGRKYLVMDTRSPAEYQVSHLPNALFVDYDHFKRQDVSGLSRKATVVVYCTVGYRSERIGEKLKSLGFNEVYNLYGGITEWVNQGQPVVDQKGNPTVKVHTYSKEWGQWLRKGEKVY